MPCVTRSCFLVSTSSTCLLGLLHSGFKWLKGSCGGLLDLEEIRGKDCPANEDEAGKCGRIIFLSLRICFSGHTRAVALVPRRRTRA